jgi:hypothetical protein
MSGFLFAAMLFAALAGWMFVRIGDNGRSATVKYGDAIVFIIATVACLVSAMVWFMWRLLT